METRYKKQEGNHKLMVQKSFQGTKCVFLFSNRKAINNNVWGTFYKLKRAKQFLIQPKKTLCFKHNTIVKWKRTE